MPHASGGEVTEASPNPHSHRDVGDVQVAHASEMHTLATLEVGATQIAKQRHLAIALGVHSHRLLRRHVLEPVRHLHAHSV
jgi:hypothetical protein